jgi:two-component system, LytTR family, sensor histidine kinase AlgZ
MPRNSRGRRYWLRMFGWSIASAVAAVVIFGGATWNTPWRRLVEPFLVSMVFTLCIVPLAAFTMPRVMPAIRGRVAFPFDWAILIPVMVAIGITGSFAAIFLLRALGYIAPGHVNRWLAGSFKQSVVMTLIFGLSISAVEALRARLDDATMALRTKERDEAEARRVAAEAQLAALESRVNPHFLFNTLNSIATLVHDDPSAAERMTTQLAALLRSSLATASVLVPLADELKLVRAYLDIERVRFGDRLRYDVRTDSDTSAARVPRLAVQTLVENSVKYAVSPSRDGATITVRAAAIDGRMQIEVVDDGPGFDGSAVPAGHGLALVRERLAMTFGERASLRIESHPGQTAAIIDVPL